MDMSWLESIIYAFISGITEFLPVSSHAHRAVLTQLFGASQNSHLLDLLIHIAVLTALSLSCRNLTSAMDRTNKLLRIPARRRKRQPDWQIVSDIRLIRSAAVPVLVLSLLFQIAFPVARQLHILALCLAVNGTLLYITGHIYIGNKTASAMNRFDSLLIGIASGAGIVPGISRVGAGVSVAVMRGAAPGQALNWSLVLSIPALAAMCVIDLILLFSTGIGTFGFMILLRYLVSALFAYIGAYLAVAILRFMAVKLGFSWFSYYSWGAALFAFVLYMI